MRPACPERLVQWNRTRRQVRNGEMAETRRNLAPVLGADKTTGRGRSGDGGPNLIPPDVILSARVHVSARSAGNKLPRAVGACAAGKPPVLGHADVWGSAARDAASRQGLQHQLQPCTPAVCNQ